MSSSISIAPAWRDGDRVEPDLRSAEEAKAYVTKVRSILRYLGTCDATWRRQPAGDVNVRCGAPASPLGTRCEIKERELIPFIGQAIECT